MEGARKPRPAAGVQSGAPRLTGAEQRIAVIGSCCSGKSTLAMRLGPVTGLPVIHLDRHAWQPGWVKRGGAEWQAIVDELVARPRWIIDGHYGGTLERRVRAADTVIFLDLPTRTCLARMLRRWWRYRGRSRPDMPEGCREHLNLEMLHWVATFRLARRSRVLRLLAAAEPETRVVRLATVGAVASFDKSLEPPDVGRGAGPLPKE